jgi:hypothetical protein
MTQTLLDLGADISTKGCLEVGQNFFGSPMEIVILLQKRYGDIECLESLKKILKSKNVDRLKKQTIEGNTVFLNMSICPSVRLSFRMSVCLYLSSFLWRN